jgi:oxygen-independent coproporphyrinogen-3 oxidase
VIVTSQPGIADRYLDSVEREVELVRSCLGGNRQIVQLHLGGGTPNYLNSAQMARLISILGRNLHFAPGAEVAIEVDPRVSDADEIRRLHDVDGFNRISFGVQDFHEATQEAIGRSQTWEKTLELGRAAREVGFESVNIDLIYGLPEQSRGSWRTTMKRFLELRPSRVAMYNFAFLPGRLAHQRRLDPSKLPDAAEKLSMFLESNELLLSHGYRFIGMDHYALEEDSLTRALDDGTLHRNFMGYTTLRGTDMVAFGVSAISDAFGGYVQNTKKLSRYEEELAGGRLPVEQGIILSDEDTRRRWIIESLLCGGMLNRSAFESTFGIGLQEYYGAELERLEPFEADGLLEISDEAIRVTPAGRFFMRNIAMVFDTYLQSTGRSTSPVFSKVL